MHGVWYIGVKLTEGSLDKTLRFVNHQEIMDKIITFQTQGFSFKSQLFNKNVNLKVKPLTWRLPLENNITKEMKVMVKQLFTS